MTGIEKAIREMIRLGEMHGRGEAEVELTIEIFQKIESLEYEDVSSDKENLQKDVRRIGEDLKVAQHKKAQMEQAGKAIVEQKTIVDDSILPPAEELAKLKEVKPELVEWVMDRAEKEQDARIDFNQGRMRLAKKELNGTIWVNVLSLAFAFLIVVCGMGATLWALKNGMEVAGTIFAGTTLVGAAALFTRIPRKPSKEK